MKEKCCLICRYKQKDVSGSGRNLIYEPSGRSFHIPLCYTHSVELFKRGQVNFIAKHEANFKNGYGSNGEQSMIDEFNETRKNFLGSWFSRAS